MRNPKMVFATLAVAGLAALGATVAIAAGGTGGGGGGGGAGGAGGIGGAVGGGVVAASTDADLQITGSASTGSPSPNTNYGYTFQIKNSGPATATGVMFSDLAPTGVVPGVISGTTGNVPFPCRLEGSLVGGFSWQCDVGDIPKGGQAVINIGVTAPSGAAAISDTAIVASGSIDPVLTNNTATVNVTVKAPPACQAGGCDIAPQQVAATCATLTNVSAPVGYYLSWAAVWNTWTIQSCSTNSEIVNVQVTETNVATGSVDYNAGWSTTLVSGQNLGMVLDNDFAPFSTSYDVSFTVTDQSGTVLATAAASAVTPPKR